MRKSKSQILRYAFLKSVPVLFGYVFLGTAFGILLQQAGYSFLWAFFISLIVFAGSMQFVLVSLLSAGASPLTVIMMTLFINSRHIFYGFSFVSEYKKMKWRYPYMIFSLTDETYSVLCGCREDTVLNAWHDDDRRSVWFFISLFHQCYWILGSVLGALIGQLLPFDFTGIDFSMTALFVVILIEQISDIKTGKYKYACIGFAASIICLLIFGADGFLLPSLIITVFIIAVLNQIDHTKHPIDHNKEQNS